MKCLKLRFASRLKVERMEDRLQPGSVLTGSGYGWSLLADNLSILKQGSVDSQSLVSQASSESSQPAPVSAPPADTHSDHLAIAVISVAAARTQFASMPNNTLVDTVAAGLPADLQSQASLTGHANSVPLAAAALPTAKMPAPATPVGSVSQSAIGVASPAIPITTAAPAASVGNLPSKGSPVQEVNVDTPTTHAGTNLQPTNDMHAVPVNLNTATHFGGGTNQATVNFLSYLGGAGPDSLNDVVVTNEGGSNFIYVSGSQTDANGRTDAFVAKLTDGATSAVWAETLPINGLPGPDVATGLSVNNGTVYLAITATDSSQTPQTDAFIASVDATAGTFIGAVRAPGASFTAVATDSSGNVYAAGSVGDPNNPGQLDIAFVQLSSDLSQTVYFNAFAFTLSGNPANSGVNTGTGLATDGQGNLFFAGYVGTFGDPTNTTDAFVGKLNADGSTFGWRHAYGNETQGPGGQFSGIALTQDGNLAVTGSLSDNGTGGDDPGSPGVLSQDLLIGHFAQSTGASLDAGGGGPFFWFVDPRTGASARAGDWTGNSLVVLADGSTIVTGAAYDPAAGSGNGDPSSSPTKGVDVHVTHFVPTDDNTTQNSDGDPENVFGGSGTDIGQAVAQDPTNPNNIYVVGTTNSADLPTTGGVLQQLNPATGTTGFVGQLTVA
ncbi:MAG TPA: hypothetical protein VKU02_14690 [Gemmataceae bacterium]|nr:hypothetical protein [Gemmataceae bacterium]